MPAFAPSLCQCVRRTVLALCCNDPFQPFDLAFRPGDLALHFRQRFGFACKPRQALGIAVELRQHPPHEAGRLRLLGAFCLGQDSLYLGDFL